MSRHVGARERDHVKRTAKVQPCTGPHHVSNLTLKHQGGGLPLYGDEAARAWRLFYLTRNLPRGVWAVCGSRSAPPEHLVGWHDIDWERAGVEVTGRQSPVVGRR